MEVEGRRYDVVSNSNGGIALELAITRTVAEIRAGRGGRALTEEEFDALFGDLPADGEG